MGRLWQSGFELNSTTAGVEWTTVTGGTIQTGTTRAGTYAGQITSLTTLTAQGFEYQFASAASSGPYYFRFYINVATLPTAANTIMVLNNTTGLVGTPEASIKLDNTGAFTLFNGLVTQIGSASPTITTGTWHSVELWFDRSPAGGSQVLKARLDGLEFASATNLTISLGVLSATFGGNLNSEAQTTGNWFFDDIAINDSTGSSQNSYPGEGKIVHMHPTGAGDNTAWAIFAGTSNWNAVSDITPNGNTSAVQSLTGGQLDDYTMTADAGIGATDTISVVAIGANFEGTGASANSKFRLRLKASSGGTVTETADIDPTSTIYVTNSKTSPLNYQLVSYFQPGTSTPWTKAVLNTSQIGLNLSSASTNRARISTEWMSVDFTPATVASTGQGITSDILNPGVGPSNIGRFYKTPRDTALHTPPNAPTAFTAVADNDYRTVLNWTDGGSVSDAAQYYRIERSTGNNLSYSEIATSASPYYIDLTGSANTVYYYRVRAHNYYGDSGYATEASVTTKATNSAWTAAIQAWLYPAALYSPIAEFADGRTIDTLKPEFLTNAAGGVITELDSPANGTYAFSNWLSYAVKSYSNKQFVTVSSGYTNFHALMLSGANQTSGITTMVNFVVNNGFSGIELDFEGYGSWTDPDWSSYKTFVTNLKSSLAAQNKQLAVLGPAIGDSPTYTGIRQSLYKFKYEEMAPLVDYISVLAYDNEYDYGGGAAVQPLDWLQFIVAWTVSKVGWSNRSKIVIGMPNYGYHATTGGFDVVLDTYQQTKAYTGFSGATYDPLSGEWFFTNAGLSYSFILTAGMNLKRKTIEDMGILNISVWHLGGNQWFNSRAEPVVDTEHIGQPIGNGIHPGLTPNSRGRFFQQLQPSATTAGQTSTQTQMGVSRIAIVTTSTQTGKSRIQITTAQTVSGLSRIQITTALTQTGVSRITATASKTQIGKADILKTASQTQTGKSRIQIVSTQAQTGKARITATTAQAQTGRARVIATTTKTQQGVSRVTATATKNQTGQSRIQITSVKTQTGVSRIQQIVNKTQTGLARITAIVQKAQTGLARITATTAKTITGVAQVLNGTARTQTGQSRITATTAQTLQGKADIKNTSTKTQTGLSLVQRTVNDNPYGLSLNGVNGTYASTPDSAAVSVTGDIEIIVRAFAADWTPTGTQAFVAKYTTVSNQRSYRLLLLSNSFLNLDLSGAGTTFSGVASSVGTSFVDGTTHWIRATWRASDGRVQYFTAADQETVPVSWTQLGSDRTIALASIFDSTTPLEVGSIQGGTSMNFAGVIYRAQVNNGIDGTLVADFAPRSATSVASTSFTAPTGETWTLNGSAGLLGNPIKGRARITNTTNQTRTGKASILQTVLRTITGKADILRTTSQTQTGTSRITVTTPKTVTGKSRIQQIVNKTQSGLARITAIVPRTLTGLARITKTTLQTIAGVSRITVSTAKTIPGKARITIITLQTIVGKSRITNSAARTQTGKSRIQITSLVSQAGVGRIQKSALKTILGRANLFLLSVRNITGHTRITAVTPRDITGTAFIRARSTQEMEVCVVLKTGNRDIILSSNDITTELKTFNISVVLKKDLCSDGTADN